MTGVQTCALPIFSWRFFKQTMVATSANHSEILAIHEASRECICLKSMIQYIRESCGLFFIKSDPKILFEDNAACIAQITGGYIKGDRTKHIHQNSFIHMNSRRVVKLMCNKYVQVII